MKQPVWAPWRMEYILSDKDDGCFLCRTFNMPARHDRENLLLYRGEHCAVVLNRYPYNNGHLMVCPYRHLSDFEEMTAEEMNELNELTVRGIRALKATMNPEGFNVGFNLGGAAGAGLKDHIHQHIVPRWIGDTNFMPVLGDTRVIPQSLEDTLQLLLPHFTD